MARPGPREDGLTYEAPGWVLIPFVCSALPADPSPWVSVLFFFLLYPVVLLCTVSLWLMYCRCARGRGVDNPGDGHKGKEVRYSVVSE